MSQSLSVPYPEKLKHIREKEFCQIGDAIYLDHAGSSLYGKSQIANYMKDLEKNLYGNPHSISPSSDLMSDVIHQVRCSVLHHFNVTLEEYDIIFTSGATGAIKLLASVFAWTPGKSKYAYLEDNHTSVIGVREVAAKHEATSYCLSLKKFTNFDELPASDLSSYELNIVKQRSSDKNSKSDQKFSFKRYNSLFAYPVQSNFSGYKYPLTWSRQVKKDGLPLFKDEDDNLLNNESWFVLSDAAGYVATSYLDLKKYPADFICLSFYKMFGFPTGLGALIVKQSSANVLCNKVYFGGGTANGYLPWQDFYRPRAVLHDRLEDGTVAFLDILALQHGFNFLRNVIDRSMLKVQHYTFSLIEKLYKDMIALKYANGNPVVEIYSYSNFRDTSVQGGILAFNAKRADGSYVGSNHMLHLASSRDIHLRGGCFCNVGACLSMLKVNPESLKNAYISGHQCGGALDMLDGHPLGAIRVSLGYMSLQSDIDALVDFLKECFLNDKRTDEEEEVFYDSVENLPSPLHNQLFLKDIYIYPVKSCRGMKVARWKLCKTGLEYDRSWMVVNEHGTCMTLKREHRLALIQPVLDLASGTLTLKADEFGSVTIYIHECTAHESELFQTKVCYDRITGYHCGEEVSAWLSNVLEKKATLIYKNPQFERISRLASNDSANAIALTNEAQYLMLSLSSVERLQRAVAAANSVENGDATLEVDDIISRFRCNFLVEGCEPFAEESWSEIIVKPTSVIKKVHFQSSGLCNRCSMICVDSKTGKRNVEPLRTLGTLPISFALNSNVQSDRRNTFGVYLCSKFHSAASISAGSVIAALSHKS